jgi:3-deoxy-manno-octulosonate cytidylyltransferase (CMP-KDO synthetase)
MAPHLTSPPTFRIVIPARYASTRLPGKLLLPIAGQPMIAHVCARALEAGAAEVVVATDDERIADVAAASGVRAVMTRLDHASGTERIAEVAEIFGWRDADRIVNLQGDEPLMPHGLIKQLAAALAAQDEADVATLCTPIREQKDIVNPHIVKAVLDQRGYALYFSRAPIPWNRDGVTRLDRGFAATASYLRHIGVYAYSVGFLRRYVGWQRSPLERLESLEQLRILWQGERIYVLTVPEAPSASVDTEADLRRVERILSAHS